MTDDPVIATLERLRFDFEAREEYARSEGGMPHVACAYQRCKDVVDGYIRRRLEGNAP